MNNLILNAKQNVCKIKFITEIKNTNCITEIM